MICVRCRSLNPLTECLNCPERAVCYGLCADDFVNPEWDEIKNEIRTRSIKESCVAHHVMNKIREDWMIGLRIKCGEKIYFTDMILKLEDRAIIVEIDEHQHTSPSYSLQRENERMNNIEATLNIPTIFIRFNPDEYIRRFGKKYVAYKSCWSNEKDARGRFIFARGQEDQWKERLEVLTDAIEESMGREPRSIIKYLFYSS